MASNERLGRPNLTVNPKSALCEDRRVRANSGPFWQVRGRVAPHAFGRKSRERVAIDVRLLGTKLVTFARYEKRRETKLSAWRGNWNSAKLVTDTKLPD